MSVPRSEIKRVTQYGEFAWPCHISMDRISYHTPIRQVRWPCSLKNLAIAALISKLDRQTHWSKQTNTPKGAEFVGAFALSMREATCTHLRLSVTPNPYNFLLLSCFTLLLLFYSPNAHEYVTHNALNITQKNDSVGLYEKIKTQSVLPELMTIDDKNACVKTAYLDGNYPLCKGTRSIMRSNYFTVPTPIGCDGSFKSMTRTTIVQQKIIREATSPLDPTHSFRSAEGC